MTGEVVLVLGGARSGKSRYAESLLTARPGPWVYVATAEVLDAEMADRVSRHRNDRGPGWITVEEPLDLAGVLRQRQGAPVLVDCLTLWLSNLLGADRDIDVAVHGLLTALGETTGTTVLVSNEVGLGIVPDNALARAFRDHAGRLHQRVAAQASRVVLTVAGLPVPVKG